MSDRVPVVIQENWETYCFNSEDGPVFASFYAGAGELCRDDLPFCARVIISIKAPNENGGPTGEEAEKLWHLEDTLTETLDRCGVGCVLVGRLTHGGNRELVFQVADWDSFRPPVGAWIKQTPEYEIGVSEHDGWGFFDDCVWPSDDDWMSIYDRRVVDGLIDAGSNPEAEHALEFVFRGDDNALARVRSELASRDYTDIDSPAETGQLVMIKNLPLDLGQISAESIENRGLARDLGVEFDGWGAMVVK